MTIYNAGGMLMSTIRFSDWDASLNGYRNEVRTDYGYDGAGRIASLAHQQRRRTTASWPAAYQWLVGFGYATTKPGGSRQTTAETLQ